MGDPRKAAALLDTFAIIAAAVREDPSMFNLADDITRSDTCRETVTQLAAIASAWCRVAAQIQGADPLAYLDADVAALLAMVEARDN